ncbi:hypothetical protein NMY22_g1991 [Coprinellus aureogranulatus]|nr:hypothetical protein NMY22_g1991 [Coprinellus aureogranulatus]
MVIAPKMEAITGPKRVCNGGSLAMDSASPRYEFLERTVVIFLLITHSDPYPNAMSALPHPFFLLTVISLLVSTGILILGALALPITPALWAIPGAFVITAAYHIVSVLLSNSGSERTLRNYSIFRVAGAYVLAFVWAGVLALALIFTVTLANGTFKAPKAYPKINPILITMSVFSAVHPIVLGAIGVVLHKERKQEQYREKWRWKQQINTSNWRSVNLPVSHTRASWLSSPLFTTGR